MTAAFVASREELERVPDGTVISWLRIPGDHTSEAVAFVRHEVESMGEGVRGLQHVTWVSPGGWAPMTIDQANVTFPATVIRWGEVPVSEPEIPPQVFSIDSGGTWARQAALDAAARVYQGAGAHGSTNAVLNHADVFLNWLTTVDAEEYERGYADGESSSSFDWKHHLGLARDDAETQLDADLRELFPVGDTAERVGTAALALALTRRGWVKITMKDNG